jgi:hypothetical protein
MKPVKLDENGGILVTIVVAGALLMVLGLAMYTKIDHDKKNLLNNRIRTTIVDDRKFLEIDLATRALPKP